MYLKWEEQPRKIACFRLHKPRKANTYNIQAIKNEKVTLEFCDRVQTDVKEYGNNIEESNNFIISSLTETIPRIGRREKHTAVRQETEVEKIDTRKKKSEEETFKWNTNKLTKKK